jgi:hypothetical protein
MAAASAALARAAAGEASADQGVVRVTASEIVGREVLPAIFATFRAKNPGVAIELARPTTWGSRGGPDSRGGYRGAHGAPDAERAGRAADRRDPDRSLRGVAAGKVLVAVGQRLAGGHTIVNSSPT